MKVKGHPDLIRTASGAICNVNSESLQAARLRKQRQKEKEQEMDDLKEEVAELRQLVRKLLDG